MCLFSIECVLYSVNIALLTSLLSPLTDWLVTALCGGRGNCFGNARLQALQWHKSQAFQVQYMQFVFHTLDASSRSLLTLY